jgi:hypothetical protein
MFGERQRRFVGVSGGRIAPRLREAILLLAEAHDYARDLQCDLWDFAVEIGALLAVGLSLDDLGWLVASGYAEQRQEVTKRRDASRKFRPARSFDFTKRTCFVLTTAGLRLTAMAAPARQLQRAA